eukprot:GHVU01138818.1.p1 GENE.GHVU01138818.1~~GHVU01138818.1.p1  ORF type:complete len:367 (+),score=51.67 GHVU01138818.1:137-1237(+)
MEGNSRFPDPESPDEGPTSPFSDSQDNEIFTTPRESISGSPSPMPFSSGFQHQLPFIEEPTPLADNDPSVTTHGGTASLRGLRHIRSPGYDSTHVEKVVTGHSELTELTIDGVTTSDCGVADGVEAFPLTAQIQPEAVHAAAPSPNAADEFVEFDVVAEQGHYSSGSSDTADADAATTTELAPSAADNKGPPEACKDYDDYSSVVPVFIGTPTKGGGGDGDDTSNQAHRGASTLYVDTASEADPNDDVGRGRNALQWTRGQKGLGVAVVEWFSLVLSFLFGVAWIIAAIAKKNLTLGGTGGQMLFTCSSSIPVLFNFLKTRNEAKGTLYTHRRILIVSLYTIKLLWAVCLHRVNLGLRHAACVCIR